LPPRLTARGITELLAISLNTNPQSRVGKGDRPPRLTARQQNQ
jgi:hypothetical protein